MIVDLVHSWLVGTVLFPISQFSYNRRGIRAEYRASAKTEYLTIDQIAGLQLKKLRAVLDHAYHYVPYYTRLFDSIGLRPGDIKSLNDIRAVPPLSRNDVIEHRLDLIDRRYKRSLRDADVSERGPAEPIPFAIIKNRPLVRNTSSGSTGAPTVFYEDGKVSALSWANELRVKRWFGIRPGLREARLVRVSPDFVLKNTANLVRRLLWNQMMLPGVNLTSSQYDLIAEQLAGFRPRSIWAFTSAAAGLARHIRDRGSRPSPWQPSLIIVWAAPLYDHEKAILSDVFDCPISNIYGLREVGHIASTCPAGELHVFQESHFLEADEKGELLVTFLRSSPMPFIRYRTGDIGELSIEKCSCGRNLQTIKMLHGRTGEIYVTPDGKMFSPNFWCRTFMDARLAQEVKRFQIIYKKDLSLLVRLVVGAEKRPRMESILTQMVQKNFGPDMRVVYEYPSEIAPQLSGKYQMVIIEK